MGLKLTDNLDAYILAAFDKLTGRDFFSAMYTV